MIFKLRDTKTHQAMPIPEGSHTVGREEHNYICVPDQSVSRRHAQVTNNSEGLFIEDLGSSNGTAVRGEFITSKTQVNIGDVVFFGSASFRVEPEVTSENVSAPAAAASSVAKPAESKPASALKPAVSSIQFSKASVPIPAASKEVPEGEMVPVEEEKETPLGAAGATLQLPKLSQLPGRPAGSPAGSPPAPVPLPAHLGGEPAPARSVGFPAPVSLPGSSAAPSSEPPPAPGIFTLPSMLAFLVGLGIGVALGVTVLAKYFH